MINKTEWNRMMEGKLYNPYKVGDNSFENVHAAQKKFNESEYWNDKSAFEELKKCFKVAPVDMVLTLRSILIMAIEYHLENIFMLIQI